MEDLLVTAPRVLAGDGELTPGWVAVRDGRIAAVGSGPAPAARERQDADGTIAPGFVDLHVHGGAGAGFDEAPERPEAVVHAVGLHRRHGTTSLLASLVSAPPAALARQVAALAELADDGVVDGIHLEGPWLSGARAGAHDRAVLRAPDPVELEALLRAGRGHVRVVTLAPELPGGIEAVERLAGRGVVAAVGHTDADHATAVRAIEAGVRLATHLFNAMPPLRHRDPGPVGAMLADDRCTVEQIADGVHVHPDVLRLAARAAGPGRWALVTDAMAAAGTGGGTLTLGGVEVDVRDGVARTTATGALAGSTLTMDAAVRGAVQLAGLPLTDSVTAAARTPAAVLGLADRGVIAPGARADLVVLDDELRAVAVLRAGSWVS